MQVPNSPNEFLPPTKEYQEYINKMMPRRVRKLSQWPFTEDMVEAVARNAILSEEIPDQDMLQSMFGSGYFFEPRLTNPMGKKIQELLIGKGVVDTPLKSAIKNSDRFSNTPSLLD